MSTAIQNVVDIPTPIDVDSHHEPRVEEAATSPAGTTLEEDTVLLKELSRKPYKSQAVWFLNAFWKEGPSFSSNPDQAEHVWKVLQLCTDIDERGEDGNELNEFDAHRLLEKVDDALTVREMRNVLRDIDLDFNKFMSLTEYLVYKFKVEWRELVHAPQGGIDAEKLALAQNKVDEAKQDLKISEVRAGEAKISEKESLHRELVAKKEEAEALEAEQKSIAAEEQASKAKEIAEKAKADAMEAESEAFQQERNAVASEEACVRAAEEKEEVEKQVKAALETVHRQEKEYNDQCKALEDIGNDDTKGIVARNKAKAELALLKVSDPLPLQRALISQQAVVRRSERATKTAAANRIAAQSARKNAEESRKVAVASRTKQEETALLANSQHKRMEVQKEEATAQRDAASNSRSEAESAARHAEKFRVAAEEALNQSIKSFQDATQFLNRVKAECVGEGQGKLWFMDRELEEAKQFMSPKQLAKLEGR